MANNFLFDLLAPIYDRIFGIHDVYHLKDIINPPHAGVLLDAAGGTGRISNELSSIFKQIVLIDLSHPMLLQSKSKTVLNPVQTSVEMLPFPNNTFDRILVVDAFHHFADQQRGIKNLIRVLRPGGRLIIQEPDINKIPVKIIAFFEKLALMGSKFLPPEGIQSLLPVRGLQSHIEYDGRFTAWIIVDKF
jgi:demethylmenaquinone methyltransferase/2-methoxy-6-polyprenyl-1,4-benzoquinol methylase